MPKCLLINICMHYYMVSYHLHWASLMSVTHLEQKWISFWVTTNWFRSTDLDDWRSQMRVRSKASLHYLTVVCDDDQLHMFGAALGVSFMLQGKKDRIWLRENLLHPPPLKDTVNRGFTQEPFRKFPKAHFAKSLHGL